MSERVYVLVHPAWFGGWCWWKVAPLLCAAGHRVLTPTLTGLGEREHLAGPEVGLATHIDDVVNAVVYEDLADVVLVGNSSSGAVITGVRDRIPDRLRTVVYLDAFVPSDGQSILELIPPERREAMEALVTAEGGGWSLPRFAPAPWERFVPEAWDVRDNEDLRRVLPRLRPTPFRHFSDPLQLAGAEAESPRRVYVRCQRWPHPGFDRHARHAESSPGWELREVPWSHLAYVTAPDDLTALLLNLAM
jgi:pimeloyl-ACP methyl ester carboxylesterase